MAYESVYESIGWKNNQSPDINEENLGRMDYALSEIDKRVVEMDARTDEKIEELDIKVNETIEELDENTTAKILEAVSTVKEYEKESKKYSDSAKQYFEKSESSAISAQSYSVASNAYAKQAESVVGTVNGYAEQAKVYRDESESFKNQASAIVGVDIATESVPGLMAGGDNAVENGILTLTKITTDRTLLKSHVGGLKVNSIEGESQQKQYTGKNKYDEVSLNKAFSYSGITATKNASGQLSFSGTSTASINEILGTFTLSAGTYYMSSGTHGGVSARLYNRTSSAFLLTNNGSFTLETDSSLDIRIQISNGVAVSGTLQTQIETGSTMTEYEPFVGNTVSPNPDYPQSIDSVVVSEIKSVGKNLLKIDVSGRTSNGIEWVCDQKTGTIKANGTASANSLLSTIRPNIKCYGETVVISAENGNPYMQTEVVYNDTSDAKKTIYFQTSVAKTVNNVKTILAITYYVAKGDTVNNLSFKPMIRFANTDDSYETYHEKVIQLSNPITLRGIGDVKDVLCKQDGVYGVLRNIKHLVLNGSEGWAYNSTNTDGTIMNYLLLLTDSAPYDNHVLCDKFAPDSNSISSTVREGIYLTYAKRLFIRINKERAGTREDFVSWLEEYNPIVDYELDTPTFEPLPTADQIALNQLETFDTVTYISTDSTIEPVIEVEYGTSKVGAYALEAMLGKEANRLEIEQLKATTLSLSNALLESEV